MSLLTEERLGDTFDSIRSDLEEEFAKDGEMGLNNRKEILIASFEKVLNCIASDIILQYDESLKNLPEDDEEQIKYDYHTSLREDETL